MRKPFQILYIRIGLVLGLLVLALSQTSAQEKQFFFVGHAYEWHTGGHKVDPRLEQIDYSVYHQIWLGGDVCSEASLNYSTLAYIDSLFHLGRPTTHWTLGNHDTRNGNIDWIKAFTQRDTYYTSYFDGICLMVLNTNLTPYHCEELDRQYSMITAVCDSISQSSHLILLMHHAIWDSIPGLPDPAQYSHTDFPFWNANCFDTQRNSFRGLIYPKLIEVQKRGVQVILLTGDMGANAKQFETTTLDGVVFMGCGLNNSYYTDPEIRAQQPRDKVLIFSHQAAERQLNWSFVELNTLLIQ